MPETRRARRPTNDSERYASSALQLPLGNLERKLIAEFLQSRGYDRETIDSMPEPERHALLTEASIYASSRLTEIESRSHFVHELHGDK